ncbi:MAG TPA: FAD-dependent oxidoreductase [Anaerovoracaceae bacterium]|nr:FAD-dependent oxidoreductase [Anaerovoracaceae bacterium]
MLDYLFSPFTIKGKTVKNRCVVPAMVTNYCEKDGKATERYIAYHEAKAKGGFGLIITEDYAVDPKGRGFSNVAGLWNDEQIESHSKLPERVHKYGALIIAQIYHSGRQTYEAVIGEKPCAPSSIPCPFSPDMPTELTAAEIEAIIEEFGDCALRAKKCGFDGVEVHGAHGYLIAEFMSLYSNKRTDQYGGTLMNRLRFPVEIIKNIRMKCGDDFIIDFRISADEMVEGGRTIEDTKTIIPILENAGLDLIHVSAGTYATADAIVPPAYTPHGWIVNFAEEVKMSCSIPVITVGRINDPILADHIIESGRADFVAMGRASLTDPEMPNKAREEKFEDIRTCIACNLGCLDLLFKDQDIKCVLNPTLGREFECKTEKASQPKKVAVVGAGPSGLQAAIAAAEAGHDVKVYEKTDRPGGQFRIAAIPPAKGELSCFVNWQETQLNKLGVKIQYNTEVDADFIKANPADVVVVATGAEPIVPPIKGIDLPHVHTAIDVLSGKANVGPNIVVIGGGQVGAETAHHFALHLKKVTLVEMLPDIAVEEALAPRWHLLRWLEKWKVNVLTNTTVTEITGNSVKAKGVTEAEIPADTVVLAAGSRPNNKLADELKAAGYQVKVIGDAEKVGLVMDAVAQGYDTGANL